MNILAKSIAMTIGMTLMVGAAHAEFKIGDENTGVVIRDMPLEKQPPASVVSAHGGDIVYTLSITEKGKEISSMSVAPAVDNKVQSTSVVLVPYLKSYSYNEETGKTSKVFDDIKIGVTFTVQRSMASDGRVKSYLSIKDSMLEDMEKNRTGEAEIDLPSVLVNEQSRIEVRNFGSENNTPVTLWQYESGGRVFIVTAKHA